MERTKTLEPRSQQEQSLLLQDGVSSMVSETLPRTDFMKTLTKSVEQKIKKVLLRYVPKDAIDRDSSSLREAIKIHSQENPIGNMLFEKLLNCLGCHVKICEKTKAELDELEMLVNAGSSIVGI